MFSETIGLGLRYQSQCPIEFSLVPAAIQRQQNLTKKKPAFIISGLTILLTLGVFWFSASETKKLVEQANYQMKDPHEKLEKAEKMVKTPDSSAASKIGQYNALGEVILQRARWSAIYNEIYRLKPNNLWMKGPCCRFTPTCSEYGRMAIERFGIWKGGWLALCRIAKCHPFYKGELYDPVPERKE